MGKGDHKSVLFNANKDKICYFQSNIIYKSRHSQNPRVIGTNEICKSLRKRRLNPFYFIVGAFQSILKFWEPCKPDQYKSIKRVCKISASM